MNILVKYAYLSFPYRCTYLPFNKIGSNVASKHIIQPAIFPHEKRGSCLALTEKKNFQFRVIPKVCQDDTKIRNWLVDFFQDYLIFLHNSPNNKYCSSVLNGKYLQFVSDSVVAINNLCFLFLFHSLLIYLERLLDVSRYLLS